MQPGGSGQPYLGKPGQATGKPSCEQFCGLHKAGGHFSNFSFSPHFGPEEEDRDLLHFMKKPVRKKNSEKVMYIKID